jgi:hypothetical protein
MTKRELDIARLKQICNALASAERFHDLHTDFGDPRIHEYGLARAQAEDMIREIQASTYQGGN